jgi:hypothetical protein
MKFKLRSLTEHKSEQRITISNHLNINKKFTNNRLKHTRPDLTLSKENRNPTLMAAPPLFISVADLDPNPDPDSPDPHVFGPPGSGSTSQRYGSGSGFFYHHAKTVRKTLIPTML